MATHAKLWTETFNDGDGVPYGLCYAQFYDVTGSTRKAVWTNRDKTTPSVSGTLLDIDGDANGRVRAYGDGVYRILVRAAGDDGSNAPIATFEGVQLVDAEEAYDGDTDPFTLESFEEDVLAGQGRQASATGDQSGTTLDLSLFDVAGGTYLVEGTAALLTFQYMTVEDYTAGARITVECTTYPIKLRARRSGEASGSYNLEIGRDFFMPVGSSIDLELRSGVWYERARFVYDAAYDKGQSGGVASATSMIVPGGTMVKVTGVSTIQNIYWVQGTEVAPPGTRLDLYFASTAIVSDGAGNIQLNGDFEAVAGASLGLISTGESSGALWVETYRNPAGGTVVTLGAGPTPSVKGTSSPDRSTAATTLLTGNDISDVTRLIDGVLGKTITIVSTNSLTPNDDYLNVRRRFQHAGSASVGYLSLQYDADFYMIPGDTLTLTCLSDGSVLYWKEIARTTADVIPEIDVPSGGSLAIWRNAHILNNTSGSSGVTITGITPTYAGGYTVRMFATTLDNGVVFNETGNIRVYSGSSITLNQNNEMHIFMAAAFPNDATIKWVQVGHSQADVA